MNSYECIAFTKVDCKIKIKKCENEKRHILLMWIFYNYVTFTTCIIAFNTEVSTNIILFVSISYNLAKLCNYI